MRIVSQQLNAAVEDKADLQAPRRKGALPRLQRLKRVPSSKGRAAMTLSELEAALAWLGANRMFAPPGRGARCAWGARQHAAWRPRTGRGGQGGPQVPALLKRRRTM